MIIFYCYFYFDDVVVFVFYVVFFNFDFMDDWIYEFLVNVGMEEC